MNYKITQYRNKIKTRRLPGIKVLEVSEIKEIRMV